MHEVLVADGVDVELGAEGLLPGDALDALADDRAGVARERTAVDVALDEVRKPRIRKAST
ncbi:hypothetical protein [Actinomycetospora soli]|uniref:hypothetical protein n=1 Tax=Actinomycetospora soli TaxID=2893887 RepID=UPI001E5F0D3A|nr:hypothetical protein [Actinomycetospora soli]MCD2189993.1 hypothetical protein [Actinomycetospora soli]